MVYLTVLWLPILLSAVVVFIASSIIHMVLGYHRSDYQKLPNEENVLESMRNEGMLPGNYHFPHVIRHLVDGLVYGLLTAGIFGWLWPR